MSPKIKRRIYYLKNNTETTIASLNGAIFQVLV